MKTETYTLENKTVIAIEGRIDTSNYNELEAEINKLDFENLVLILDFSKVSYITSAGLRVLLVCRRKLSQETMILANVSEIVKEVFDTSGFTSFFTFTEGEVKPENNMEESCYTFTDILAKQALSHKEKKVFHGQTGYTWEEIEKCSEVMASDLAKQGVKKGSHVAICSPNSINWIIAFFAIQKLKALAILVNFTSKPNEIISLSKIGDITHFCYGYLPGVSDYEEFISQITVEDSKIKNVYNIKPDVDFRTRLGENCEFPDYSGVETDPDDPSVMIFTSGSTGLPKGVLFSSFNLVNSANDAMKLFKIRESDRICQFLPLFHIFGFGTNFITALFCGSSLFIPENTHPDTVLKTIYENRCTIFHSIPTMIFAIVKSPEFTPEKVSSIRCSFMGGAPITEEQMKELMKIFPNNHFGNIYGMSEKPLISITDYEDSAAHITQTVGKPVNGVSLEIRELGSNKVLPNGEIGEITIKSDSALTAYYKLDIEKQALDEDGWLPTGDLGFMGDDGYLRITGRCKDLIIRAGENISPNEVAKQILKLENIEDAKVFGAPDELLGEKVVAAVVVRKNFSFDETQAKDFLKEHLAKAKIPEKFIVFEKFPVLGTGKIDAVTLKKDLLARI